MCQNVLVRVYNNLSINSVMSNVQSRRLQRLLLPLAVESKETTELKEFKSTLNTFDFDFFLVVD